MVKRSTAGQSESSPIYCEWLIDILIYFESSMLVDKPFNTTIDLQSTGFMKMLKCMLHRFYTFQTVRISSVL